MGGVFGVIGAVFSVVGSLKSASAQKKAAKAQRQQNDLQTRRSQRAQIRTSVITRAQSIASAQAAGSFNSSGAAGGIGSLSSRTGATLGFQSQFNGLSNVIGTQTAKANTYSGLASLGGTIFQNRNELGAFFGR